ncbi:ArsR family transcriptional regulator [bacterium]|nr:MAG: ArsR family transcriptional regulator [bacterium]
MHHLIQLGRHLSDPLTVRILLCLLSDEMGVAELQRLLNVRRSRLDTRLAQLRDAGLVGAEQEGRYLRFRVMPDKKDLVVRIFNEFSEEIEWDPEMSRVRKRLAESS